MSAKIFISYRRSDTKADARSIHQWLQARFGRDALFIDIDAIRKGRNFVDALHQALSETAVLVCVIGPNWLSAADGEGKRRIDSAEDYVRLEITTALKRGIPVIPVRVEAQSLPDESDLPDDLKPLVRRMATVVTHENFSHDMEGLEQELSAILRPARYIDRLKGQLQTNKRWVVFSIICLFLTAVASRSELLAFSERLVATANALRYGTSLPDGTSQAKDVLVRMQEAQLRLKYEARRQLSPNNQADGVGWAWSLAQMFAAAPDTTTELKERYLAYLESKLEPECSCFWADGIPHTVISAWVLMGDGKLNGALHTRVLRGLLQAQDTQGWWSIALDATSDAGNASAYATSLAVMALVSYRNSLPPAAPERQSIAVAVDGAVTWLSLQVPRAGIGWRDYPGNEGRSTSNPMFGAMVITAIAAAKPQLLGKQIASEAISTKAPLAEPTLYFSSDVFISRKHGKSYIDKYRHVPFPWQVSGLVAAYPYLDLEDRARILVQLRQALSIDFSNDTFKRQEWLLAEQVYLLRRVLSAQDTQGSLGKAVVP